jgi:hypothetical protein
MSKRNHPRTSKRIRKATWSYYLKMVTRLYDVHRYDVCGVEVKSEECEAQRQLFQLYTFLLRNKPGNTDLTQYQLSRAYDKISELSHLPRPCSG